MQDKSFSKESLLTLITEAVIFVCGLIYLIILARVLGPVGKGIYSLILFIPGLMMIFGSLGIESSNVYFVGRKKYETKEVVANSLTVSCVSGALLIFIFWGITMLKSFQIFISSNQISILHLWLVILIIPIYFISSFFRNILRGYGDIVGYNKIRLVESITLLLSGVLFLTVLNEGILGAVISYIFSIISGVLISIFLISKISKITLSFNKILFRDFASFGTKVYLANGLSFLNYRLDVFLIALFLVPAQVGFYSVSASIAEKLLIIPGALATVLFPRISSISETNASDLTSKILRHTTIIMIIASLLLIVLAAPLINVFFGKSFLPSVLSLIILLPGIFAFSIGSVIAADLSGRGKPQYAVWSSMTALIANVILNIILIPRMGIVGAALASSISYWLDTLVVLIAYLNISRHSLREVLIIKKDDFQDYYNLFLKFKTDGIW